jgi:hypothetical protein
MLKCNIAQIHGLNWVLAKKVKNFKIHYRVIRFYDKFVYYCKRDTPMRGLSMCTAVEAALALYSQKVWMKNCFIQHSGRFNFIQTPYFGCCGVSGISVLTPLRRRFWSRWHTCLQIGWPISKKDSKGVWRMLRRSSCKQRTICIIWDRSRFTAGTCTPGIKGTKYLRPTSCIPCLLLFPNISDSHLIY